MTGKGLLLFAFSMYSLGKVPYRKRCGSYTFDTIVQYFWNIVKLSLLVISSSSFLPTPSLTEGARPPESQPLNLATLQNKQTKPNIACFDGGNSFQNCLVLLAPSFFPSDYKVLLCKEEIHICYMIWRFGWLVLDFLTGNWEVSEEKSPDAILGVTPGFPPDFGVSCI